MPRTAKQTTPFIGSSIRATLVVLAVLALGRTAWQSMDAPSRSASELDESLAVSDSAKVFSQRVLTPTATGLATNDSPEANRGVPTGGVQASAEMQQLVAQISVVCPSAARELQRELTNADAESRQGDQSEAAEVAPEYELLSHRTSPAARAGTNSAQAKITGIRVAQRPGSRTPRIALNETATTNGDGGEWLVAPEQWYVPEDASLKSSTKAEAPKASGTETSGAEAGGIAPSAEPAAEEAEIEEFAPPAQPTPDTPAVSVPSAEKPKRPAVTSPQVEQPSPETKVSEPVVITPSVPAPETDSTEVEPAADAPTPEPSREVPSAEDEGPSLGFPAVSEESPPSDPVVQPRPVVESPVVESPAVESTVESSPAEEAASEPAADSAPPPAATVDRSSTREVLPPKVEAVPRSLPSAPSTAPAAASARPAFTPPTLPSAPQPEPSVTPSAGGDTFAPPPLGMPSMHGGGNANSLEGARQQAAEMGIKPGEDPHAKFFEEMAGNCFPSAKACAKCHEKIYHEWSCSSHAYAMVSPMFHKFEQKITEVSMGTVGYFCQRCHAPVATSLGIPRDMPLWKQPEVAREGVTCVACHRVNQRYGKSNGERRVLPGDEYAPVYGGIGGAGVAEVIAQKDKYKVKTSPNEKGPGQAIHTEGRYFDQLSASEYCASCHQVAVHPGIKLEVVWEQYRASPAHKQGITCQACHMGKVPGVASGYERCAIAEVAGKKVDENRKHSNHVFYGPGYSIAHPGVFPFHLKADRWKFDEWLQFDWRAGWGTEAFEDKVDAGEIRVRFPAVWAEADDRYDAREIIEDNQAKLKLKTKLRTQVMENGSHVDGPFFAAQPRAGCDLNLHYVVANTNSGHNLPTASLGAQPQLWANVVLIGPRGQRLWETGYTDRYGDVCDIHSREVRAGKVPFDSQLFNLQTMFLITGAVGTDREFFLPVNVDFDQLPFLRPGAIPVSVTNHPPFIRMESRSIGPLGKKKVNYKIPGHLIREPGRYRLSFRMRSRTEPIYFMDFCGATAEMQRAMNEGMIDVHPYSVEFNVQ